MNKLIFFLLVSFGLTQQQSDLSYQVSSEKYFSDKQGKIKMVVNVWGHVNLPGLHEVYDGIDLATLMSIVGGPKPGANLRKVRLYREIPEGNIQMVYTINFDKFFNNGDRSEFIKVKPNDTIVIPQKFSNYIFANVGTLNTLLSFLNLYFQIQNTVR